MRSLPANEGLVPALPQGFGPLPGFAAAPPQGVTVPGLTPAGQTPALPGFDAANPALTGPQVVHTTSSSKLRDAAVAVGAELLPNGTARYAGRPFDPLAADGPITPMEYRTTTITPDGLINVREHLCRFESSQANTGMLERLDGIARGEFLSADCDLRFYTHELREQERYRALGVPNGADPGYDVWNNLHIATLADFGLTDTDSSRNPTLYHPDTWLLIGK